jgi:pimeloyl-ACP methyl ester carboxylesterase
MLSTYESGFGSPVVLIHGFPMHAAVWTEVAEHLNQVFRVVCVDLPGFGYSPPLPSSFTIADVGAMLANTLKERMQESAVIVGHSLGGYVALALASSHPELVRGLVLVHSTAYPDAAEKKQMRTKVVDLVKSNGVEAFTANFIQPLFADPNHPRIEEVRRINLASSAEAVIGYTLAMRDRPDMTGLLRSAKFPVLFVAGDRDPGIPLASVQAQTELSSGTELQVLAGQAHMAIVEEPKKVADAIEGFALKLPLTQA